MCPAPVEVEWSSERRLRVAFGADDRALAAYQRLAGARLPGVVDLVPAFRTIHVEVAMPAAIGARGEDLRAAVRRLIEAPEGVAAPPPGPLVELPVCYDPDLGPDLAEVAGLHGLTPAQAAALHASAEYTVRFLGFSPGFPYLAGLPARLATPRLATPRARVPAGSVALAADQAGIYPQATAGGWRILGRTPLALFDPRSPLPARLAPGDRVRFVPISRDRFDALQGDPR